MSGKKKWQIITMRVTPKLHVELKQDAWARKISLNELCVLLVAREPLPERWVPDEATEAPTA